MSMKLAIATSPFGNGAWDNPDVGPFKSILKHRISVAYGTSLALKNADVLLLWGGVDIFPGFYGQKAIPENQCGEAVPNYRDMFEWSLIRDAVDQGVPIIGICRGAQMLCAAAGGSLYQDVNGHESGHDIETYDGKVFRASANHHQMMCLEDAPDAKVLAWSPKPLATKLIYHDGASPSEANPPEKEPEVVFFPNITALAIQPHPEWHANATDPFPKWVLEQVEQYIAN